MGAVEVRAFSSSIGMRRDEAGGWCLDNIEDRGFSGLLRLASLFCRHGIARVQLRSGQSPGWIIALSWTTICLPFAILL